MILAVDFDGTIVEHKYPHIGKPIEGAIEYLIKLKEKNDTLILWTCREGKELEEAVTYCGDRGLTFHAVNENYNAFPPHIAKRKIYADVYIDDKNFGMFDMNWKEIYLYINGHYRQIYD